MSSRMSSDKNVSDIKECIIELQKEFFASKIPINDDSVNLHRFQETLESILHIGLKEPNLLGVKKSYWDYICCCFYSNKKSHDGLHYVKSMPELKTSLGRGRAFLRFCLMQKCLADTLQSCFINDKVTREFFNEKSVLLHSKLSSDFIGALYDLNELNFNLVTKCFDLDFSWPVFSRKIFTTSDDSHDLRKNNSLSNFDSNTLQDFFTFKSDIENMEENFIDDNHKCEIRAHSFNENILNSKQANVHSLEKAKSISELEIKIKLLQEENQNLSHKLSIVKNNMSVNNDSNINNALVFNDINQLEPFSLKMPDLVNNFDKLATQDKSCSCTLDLEDHSNKNQYSKLSLEHDTNINVSYKNQDITSTIDKNATAIKINDNSSNLKALLIEMKNIIDKLQDTLPVSSITTNILSLLSRLDSIHHLLDITFIKDKTYFSFNKSLEMESNFIKNFVNKHQEAFHSLQDKIDKSLKVSKNLSSKLIKLQDLLQSYGLLKISMESDINIKKTFAKIKTVTTSPDTYSESEICEVLDFSYFDPDSQLSCDLYTQYSNIKLLDSKVESLCCELNSSLTLNNFIISKVQDQELHWKGFSKELEQAQIFISVLKEQHRKLQSSEDILKYDLQEKRKILTRLKKQLETTREDWNLVRQKNSKSEADWQVLRKEFMQRHKQTSEESGFVDDKELEEISSKTLNCIEIFENDSSNSTCDNIKVRESYQEPIQKTRLEILEEQCKNLFSSLLQNSKKRNDLANRLETLCNGLEKSPDVNDNSNLENASVILSDEPILNDGSESLLEVVAEKLSEIHVVNNVQISPELGSSSSELNFTLTNSIGSSDSFSESPSLLRDCDDETFDIQRQVTEAFINVPNTVSILNNISSSQSDNLFHNAEYQEVCQKLNNSDLSHSFHSHLSEDEISNNEFRNSISLENEFNLCCEKNDLEKDFQSPKNQNISFQCSEIKKYSEPCSFHEKQNLKEKLCPLEKENKLLESKVLELEKKCLLIEEELDQTNRQLILSKATKEQEVAALQFQLSTEALKYQRALKQFSEQDNGLESMKTKVSDQEQLIFALEEAITEIRLERKFEKERQWQELEEIHIALTNREEECIALSENLENLLSALNEEKRKNAHLLSQLEEIKSARDNEKMALEKEVSRLQNDSKEFKKKLIRLLKEKDLLWKKTDHLTHIQKVKMTDRWMDDREVSHCLACRTHFTFILRKHHCRLCGRIFCHICANNWLLTASSKHRIRVCNECYVQHIEIKKETRRGSDVPSLVDDSEDEAVVDDISLNPTSNSSCNSELPLSINNSIISLPTRGIDLFTRSPQLVSSAPDLRCIFKQDESKTRPKSLIYEFVTEEGDGNTMLNSLTEENSKILPTSSISNNDYSESNSIEKISTDVITQNSSLFIVSTYITKDITATSEISGEFFVTSRKNYGISIICENFPIQLYWSFSCDSWVIPISLFYYGKHDDLVQETLVFNSSNVMEGNTKLLYPGLYILQLNIMSDEYLPQKIIFTLKAKQIEI